MMVLLGKPMEEATDWNRTASACIYPPLSKSPRLHHPPRQSCLGARQDGNPANLTNCGRGSSQSRDSESLFYISTYSNIVSKYAKELFSLFILAVARQISNVGGQASELSSSDCLLQGTRAEWRNTLFTELAESVVQSGLVEGIEEALSLVIPAFAAYNLVPEVAN